jgi:Cyclic nucleotide-binding domain
MKHPALDEAMYLIDSGQVKLSMSSASGKDCLLAIYSNGDVFGESCFTSVKRFETATAMQTTVVRLWTALPPASLYPSTPQDRTASESANPPPNPSLRTEYLLDRGV